jgi:hypothetical protein
MKCNGSVINRITLHKKGEIGGGGGVHGANMFINQELERYAANG